MGKILVHVGTSNGEPRRSSLEVLSHVSREIATDGDEVIACVFDATEGNAAASTATFGADRLLSFTDPVHAEHMNDALVSGLVAAMEHTDPSHVVFASSEAVKDVLGAVAVRTGAAVLPDVVSFSIGTGFASAVRPVMAAKSLAVTEARSERILISVRSGSVEAIENPKSPVVEALDTPVSTDGVRLKLREILKAAGDTVDLSEANVVVAAGRGVRDEEGKKLVEDLAALFGGGIGASRAVVETNLFPATAQIGQTGKVVSPDLYFALGISGAIQHVAGMSNSRVIVAVNKDPDAPIFEYATYGIVGDLYRIVPLLIEEIRNRR